MCCAVLGSACIGADMMRLCNQRVGILFLCCVQAEYMSIFTYAHGLEMGKPVILGIHEWCSDHMEYPVDRPGMGS